MKGGTAQLVIQVILICVVPYLSLRFSKGLKISQWLSPVIICYGVGILISNFHLLSIHEDLSHRVSEGTILMAIPLLLYSTDLKAWLKYARATIISFVICVLAGIFSSVVMAFFLGGALENAWQYSGMIAGVYTGGIPNVQAIGLAINAPEESFVLLYAADIFCGGIYLLFLTSIAGQLFAKIFPAFKYNNTITKNEDAPIGIDSISFLGIVKSLLWTVLVVGASVGLTKVITGQLNSTIVILLLTTFSVFSSFLTFVKRFDGAYQAGEYFLLMFCIAVGLLSDFGTIWAEGTFVIWYMGAILLLTITIHLLISYFLKIDRDTVMITSTAALYGPAFIGQVASVIGNRQLVFSGIATGLVGLAVGNYIGVGVAYLVKWLL